MKPRLISKQQAAQLSADFRRARVRSKPPTAVEQLEGALAAGHGTSERLGHLGGMDVDDADRVWARGGSGMLLRPVIFARLRNRASR